MGKLDDILDKTLHVTHPQYRLSTEYIEAKQQIKDLMLELIGGFEMAPPQPLADDFLEVGKIKHGEYNRIAGRNELRSELVKKVEAL